MKGGYHRHICVFQGGVEVVVVVIVVVAVELNECPSTRRFCLVTIGYVEPPVVPETE